MSGDLAVMALTTIAVATADSSAAKTHLCGIVILLRLRIAAAKSSSGQAMTRRARLLSCPLT
jgi:hypothetical protein